MAHAILDSLLEQAGLPGDAPLALSPPEKATEAEHDDGPWTERE